jgi:SAM-dependent methyltransferase
MSNPNISNVKEFWNNNPLFTGESKISDTCSPDFFQDHEKIVIKDCFAGRIESLYFRGIKRGKILDAGCGTGFWVRQFCSRGVETHALDLSENSIIITKQSLGLFAHKANLYVADVENLPFKARSFNHINCQGVIHHTPNTEKCIKEFHYILKNGGTLCFSVYYKNIVLKNRLIFKLVKTVAKSFHVGLKGRGRENMLEVSSPEDLVRMYDGAYNPIGKAYTKKEIAMMTKPYFDILRLKRHYFPTRFLPFKITTHLHRLLHNHFGLMIVLFLKKKSEYEI